MIRLTRLNGREFLLNAELIKFMEETPDTVITLVNGERFLVTESADDVVDRVVEYGRMLRPFRQD
ncbi:MAG: flagellar FlbD family protein [Planctomycetota bacterium]